MATPAPEPSEPPRGWRAWGPGLVVAATGVGAGDLIAAAVAGRRYGITVLWVVVAGAWCKWALNMGVARWQLSTGETMIAGWARRLPRWVSWYFGGYVVLWGLLVAGALGSACGVAIKALWPEAPGGVAWWTAVHAIGGGALVAWGGYAAFERVMKILVGTMAVLVVGCAVFLLPPLPELLRGLFVPRVPAESAWFLLGLMGGVGGSATILCYGYWLRERGWAGVRFGGAVRSDLAAAYTLTGVFGLAMVVLAAGAQPADASGNALVVALAERLGELLGSIGRQMFLWGFWCAVLSSLLGVWQGVPYLFADWWAERRRCKHGVSGSAPDRDTSSIGERAPAYRAFLLWLVFPPLLLQLWGRPLALVIAYAVAGAFFMPFLAATLLVMLNRRDWMGGRRAGALLNGLLMIALLVFAGLFLIEAKRSLFG